MDQRQDDKPAGEKSLQLSVLIAEANAIRQEITNRSNSQGTLMQVNITAAGAVASFALANHAYAPILVVLPILSPVLGLLWMDHDAAILKLGRYIRDIIAADYERIALFKFPDYERYVKELPSNFPSTSTDFIYFSTAVFVTFGLLPLVALFM
jgi:hypothetical protein